MPYYPFGVVSFCWPLPLIVTLPTAFTASGWQGYDQVPCLFSPACIVPIFPALATKGFRNFRESCRNFRGKTATSEQNRGKARPHVKT